MCRAILLTVGVIAMTLAAPASAQAQPVVETGAVDEDARMDWWREARFGLFIHWGLYAIPAGAWGDETGHGEWIRHTARIPVHEYDRLIDRFDPVLFDADEWVLAARAAGMKYIVITSKHHDGFCLFDSAHTDFDIMSTPFKRDVLKELSDACRRHGLKICWYHSIMDWHHPDYLPRRPWEESTRLAEGADFDRYVDFMKRQLRELLTNYGPIGVLWFDGEWEGTWTHERGQDLYEFVRSLQPDIIINNRVDVGRSGMAGMTKEGRFAGDFGTPEQEVPATGIPDVDWETCLTMNTHWGYNRRDLDYKSTEQLVRTLVDVVSKGGNLLLNVGPKADGSFPVESVERLREIGAWMEVNGASIQGTQASPFRELAWGRCTQKPLPDGGTRLFLHVFDWPEDGALDVRGIYNAPRGAHLLADADRRCLPVERHEDALFIRLPEEAPDAIDTVVVLDVVGRADTNEPPEIAAELPVFIDTLEIRVASDRENVEVRYTTDGKTPTNASPLVAGAIQVKRTTTVRARAFRDGRPVSGVREATFTKVLPRPSVSPCDARRGVSFEYFEGEWDVLPAFDRLAPVKSGVAPGFDLAPRNRAERFAFRYQGFIEVPCDGVYRFFTVSDDGSRLYIGDALVVDNDGLHGAAEADGVVALAAGTHPITVTYFEKTGGDLLEVWYAGPGIEKRRVPAEALSHE
ncbi:MAG: alpha-L-fucosidase [Planctomycetota bacterium]|jgi:alpha-L-fucosidase